MLLVKLIELSLKLFEKNDSELVRFVNLLFWANPARAPAGRTAKSLIFYRNL